MRLRIEVRRRIQASRRIPTTWQDAAGAGVPAGGWAAGSLRFSTARDTALGRVLGTAGSAILCVVLGAALVSALWSAASPAHALDRGRGLDLALDPAHSSGSAPGPDLTPGPGTGPAAVFGIPVDSGLAFGLGLAVALGGALLLAAGSELQSRAVFEAGGRWRAFLRSRRWWGGLLALGTAVSSNFVALALAPVSVVQSVSIVALALSAAFAHWSGRARVGWRGAVSIGLCAVGISGFVLLVRSSLSEEASADPLRDLAAVIGILAALTALGLVATVAGSRGRTASTQPASGAPGRGWRLPLGSLSGLFAAALIFGSITTVFKVLVTLALRDGIPALLSEPTALLGIAAVAAGGIIANILLQRSHHRFAAPVVVAGITIVDPLTAAVIGMSVLGEVQLTAGLALSLLAFGTVACLGVLGLTQIRRTEHPLRGGVGAAHPGTAASAPRHTQFHSPDTTAHP